MGDWNPAAYPIRLFRNPRAAAPGAPYPPALDAILSAAGFAAAEREIAGWPGHAPTPLVELPGLAQAAGLGRLWYKDEGGRFGLGSFKALGGAYAVFRLLAGIVADRTGAPPVSAADLLAGRYAEVTRDVVVTTATDGNHGRSVAWGAQVFGCRCVVYIHATVSEGRRAAIERFGAEVRRVAGNYDDSVRRADADAAAHGWLIVSDTSYDGYTEVPRTVMQGYGVVGAEALRQLPAGAVPTHVFLQAGVGGLAAAVYARLWQGLGRHRPRLTVVEPERADCLYRSARNGRPTAVHGPLDTLMAGLAAGEVSRLAWPILDAGAEAFMTIPDAAAVATMRALAEGIGGDRPVVGGEAGVGGLAGCLAAAAAEPARRTLGLDAATRVLVIGSEGDTDPDLYREIVGRSAGEVGAA